MTKFISINSDAKDYKVQTGQGISRVQEEQKTEARPHNLCGLVHKRGKCSHKCSGCNKYGSHKEADCWELYPHKKPKDYETEAGGDIELVQSAGNQRTLDFKE